MTIKHLAAITAIAILTACGGGGGSGDGPAPAVAIYGDSLTTGEYTGGQHSPTPAQRIAEYSGHPVAAYAVQGLVAPAVQSVAGQGEPVVLFRLGYADAVLGVPAEDTRAAMERLVSDVRSTGRRAVIVGVLAAPEPYTAAAAANNATMRGIATSNGLQFIDVQAVGPVALIDNIHPTQAAADAVALFIAKEIVK
jgi:hypothetical protein